MLALFVEAVFSGGNGPPDAFLQSDPRLPRRCLGETAIISYQPHGLVAAVRAFAPEQQAARLAHLISCYFSHLPHAGRDSRADIVSLTGFRMFSRRRGDETVNGIV